MRLYLGFDCSTQSFSAIVLAIDGTRKRTIFEHSLNFDRDFPTYGTHAGVRQGANALEVVASPIMWAEGLDRMLGIVAGALGVDVAHIAAISGSAQQHGTAYLNDTAKTIWSRLDPRVALVSQIGTTFSRAESPVWMDESTSEQCQAIERALGGADAIKHLTGSRACERFAGPQISKFVDRQPAAYADTARIHLVSSYLASLLIGADAPIDFADGSGMNLMDLTAGRWSPAALEATAPDLAARLPDLQPSWTIAGTLSPYWQQRYGYPAARVVVCSGDNPCSIVGGGIVRQGLLGVSLGTSDTVFACVPEPAFEASHVFASPTGGFMHLVCFRNGSLARERVRNDAGLDWDGFEKALASTPAGNDGALMLPWFDPESTPRVSHAGVHRFGLDANDHARNVRAVVEAQMMAMANHATIGGSNRVDRVVAMGGGAVNRAILQVMADVFGAVVEPTSSDNAACLGAALRAYHADRLADGQPVAWTDVVDGITTSRAAAAIAPIAANLRVYERLRRRYAECEAQAIDSAASERGV